jgi:ATP-dependent Clp protease ATP-binding subunit ClpA
MFERFTDRARRVVVLAAEEARRLDHPHIGTEHLLLGLLLEPPSLAARERARTAGVDVQAVVEENRWLHGEVEHLRGCFASMASSPTAGLPERLRSRSPPLQATHRPQHHRLASSARRVRAAAA